MGLLQVAAAHVKPGGLLLVSASGVSDDLNANYADLYRRDREATGEQNSYYSRDKNGVILYQTHHFERQELESLIRADGAFEVARLVEEKEASSRRPDEKARFFYVCAR